MTAGLWDKARILYRKRVYDPTLEGIVLSIKAEKDGIAKKLLQIRTGAKQYRIKKSGEQAAEDRFVLILITPIQPPF